MKACIKNENKALQIMIYHLIKVKRLRAATFIPSEALVATKMHSKDLIFIPQVQDGSLQSKNKTLEKIECPGFLQFIVAYFYGHRMNKEF